MIAGADPEDPEPIEHNTNGESLPCHPGPDCRKTGKMHQNERYGRGIDDVVMVVDHRIRSRVLLEIRGRLCGHRFALFQGVRLALNRSVSVT